MKLLFQRLFNKYENILSTTLNKWRNNVARIKVKTAGERVARFTENKYKTSKARKNWLDISRLLDLYSNNRLIYEILRRIKKYIALKKLVDTLENRQKKNAWDDVIDGLNYLAVLKKLKYIIENWDKRQDIFLMIHYLRKWNNIAKKLKERDDTLEDALKKISERNLLFDSNTLNHVFTLKKVLHDIPLIRSKVLYQNLRTLYEINKKYKNLGKQLTSSRKDMVDQAKDILLDKLYKLYYYKILEKLFDKLSKILEEYKLKHGEYFMKLMKDKLLSGREFSIEGKNNGQHIAPTVQLSFKAHIKNKRDVTNEDKNPMNFIIPYLVKYLQRKIKDRKDWAWKKLLENDLSNKFCKLVKAHSDEKMLPQKRELVDILKANSAYLDGLGDAYMKLYNLLRRYFVRKVCQTLEGPSRVYRLLYLIKVVLMHKTIAYQRYIREMVRKWRFAAFIQNMSRRKLELMYKNLHVSYLQMANEVFGDKGASDASVVKEFERFNMRIGAFVNEDYTASYETNFCETISKKYVFQPVEILVDKEGSSHIYGLSKDLNDDYYIDKDFEEQTEGKYKSETNKSLSKFNGRSFADGDVKEEQKYKRKNY